MRLTSPTTRLKTDRRLPGDQERGEHDQDGAPAPPGLPVTTPRHPHQTTVSTSRSGKNGAPRGFIRVASVKEHPGRPGGAGASRSGRPGRVPGAWSGVRSARQTPAACRERAAPGADPQESGKPQDEECREHEERVDRVGLAPVGDVHEHRRVQQVGGGEDEVGPGADARGRPARAALPASAARPAPGGSSCPRVGAFPQPEEKPGDAEVEEQGRELDQQVEEPSSCADRDARPRVGPDLRARAARSSRRSVPMGARIQA